RHTRLSGDWSSDVCSSDLDDHGRGVGGARVRGRGRPLHKAGRGGTRVGNRRLGGGGRTVRPSPLLRPFYATTPERPRAAVILARSEERRVGKEGGRRCSRR